MPWTTLARPLSVWTLLVWLLLSAGGLVAASGEDDEVIEIEPPAPLIFDGSGPDGSP